MASLGACLPSLGQWQQLGSGLNGGVRSMNFDDTNDRLYTFGFYAMYGGSFPEDAVSAAYWQDNAWQQLGLGLDEGPAVSSVLLGGDSVLVSGFFFGAIGVPDTRYTALWDGTQWRSIGSGGSHGIAWGLLDNEDGVTAAGAFDSIAGIPANRIARLSNGTWESICAHPTTGGFISYQTVTKYNGDYIFGGNINLPEIKEIGWLDGDTLRQLGPGILGDSWVNDMVVYEDKVFIGGEFYAASGNPGSGLMTWDGTAYADPVPGVQFTTQVVDLDVHNGEVFISGRSQLPGSSDYYSLARYNGDHICLFGKNLNTVFLAIAASDNELFVAPNMITLGLDGDTVNYIARYDLTYPADTCVDLTTGLRDRNPQNEPWAIGPNPCSDHLVITHGVSIAQNERRSLLITDALARTLFQQDLSRVDPIAPVLVRLPRLPAGSYMANVLNADGAVVHSQHLLIVQ